MARSDELIKKSIVDQMTRDDRVDASGISTKVINGIVTLSGEVPTYYARSAAHEVAVDTVGVLDVQNDLVVNYPDFISIPTDSEIQEALNHRLLANPDIDLKELEVDVNAGLVTLKGTVNTYWKKIRAQQLAAHEPGVVSIDNHIAVVPTDNFLDKVLAEEVINSLESKALVDAEDVTVQVNEGEVTLTGKVPNWSARRAAEEAVIYNAGVTNLINRLTVSNL